MHKEVARAKAMAFRHKHGPVEKMTPKQRRRLRHYLAAWQATPRELEAEVWVEQTDSISH